MDVTELPTTTLDYPSENESIILDDTECFYEKGFTIFTYTVDDLLLAASMAATICNVMVLFCAVKLYKRSGDTMHLFVFSMTSADLILTVFCHPNEMLIRKHEFLQQVHLCAVVHYFNWVGLAASGLSLTLLNVDKLIFFRFPLSYDRSMSKKRAIYFVIIIWVTSIGFVTYCWIFNIVYIFPKDCTLQVKSLVFIFATTFWTSFSLLPYRIVNLGRIHFFKWKELTCDERQTMSWIAWSLIYLLSLNPIVNPLITSLIYAPYRMTIKKFLVNIPIGNRPLYSQDENNTGSDTSLVMRRSRNRRYSATELASLRQSTEVTRMSLCETPWTPGGKSPGASKTDIEFNFNEPTTNQDTNKKNDDKATEDTEITEISRDNSRNSSDKIVKEVKFSA